MSGIPSSVADDVKTWAGCTKATRYLHPFRSGLVLHRGARRRCLGKMYPLDIAPPLGGFSPSWCPLDDRDQRNEPRTRCGTIGLNSNVRGALGGMGKLFFFMIIVGVGVLLAIAAMVIMM